MNAHPDPVGVAAGLQDWQKHALLAASGCKGGQWWTPYHVEDTRLARNGVLTELGLAVRQSIQDGDQG